MPNAYLPVGAFLSGYAGGALQAWEPGAGLNPNPTGGRLSALQPNPTGGHSAGWRPDPTGGSVADLQPNPTGKRGQLRPDPTGGSDADLRPDPTGGHAERGAWAVHPETASPWPWLQIDPAWTYSGAGPMLAQALRKVQTKIVGSREIGRAHV